MLKGFATNKNIVYFIAGLISPSVLLDVPAHNAAIKKCRILEIRYDLFNDVSQWGALSQKVFDLNPKALRLGTIRLEKDGGKWKNEQAAERAELFEKVSDGLDLIDLERGVELPLKNKIIRSWHLFDRVPSEPELAEFAQECLESGAYGCKVAAMAGSKDDVLPLYDFSKKYGNRFELFAAFAMGEHGKESRVRSLAEGANLTYASIGEALAPGQLSVDFF